MTSTQRSIEDVERWLLQYDNREAKSAVINDYIACRPSHWRDQCIIRDIAAWIVYGGNEDLYLHGINIFDVWDDEYYKLHDRYKGVEYGNL